MANDPFTTHHHYLQAHLSPNPADYRTGLLLYTDIPHGPCDAHTWAQATWNTQYNTYASVDFKEEWRLKVANANAGFEMMCERERLNEVPRVYRELFQRTREFADGVGKLVGALGRGGCCEDGHGSFDVINTGKIPPTTTKISTWAEAACLLVQWSRGILRHPSLGFEKLLLSQRESIHWILDDALLRICLDHWDTVTPSHLPWDLATAPLQDCLMQACKLIPEWAARDADEYRKWDVRVVYSVREALEQSYFGRSRRFLAQSRRLHELWRTVGLWGGGRLPVELAEVIVGIVCAAEGLPEGNLRKVFLPAKEKKVERNGNGNGNAFGYLRATAVR
ncbi:hypothetical protein IAQ61_005532 [Plenodomus lingam]|uniref:uncharacterized protein n=1 Tax=Leptosphaeria maculans TaxID=5022 RepID=UPI0033226A9C|nr:hypothetical protein IAQ61_005532 [Plenodomus lingam]